jgi:uncharacterized membrane protein
MTGCRGAVIFCSDVVASESGYLLVPSSLDTDVSVQWCAMLRALVVQVINMEGALKHLYKVYLSSVVVGESAEVICNKVLAQVSFETNQSLSHQNVAGCEQDFIEIQTEYFNKTLRTLSVNVVEAS